MATLKKRIREIRKEKTTKLNEVQLYLLRLFSSGISGDDLKEIQSLLKEYYRKRVDAEIDKVVKGKKITQKSLDKLLQTHTRTPYKR